MDVRFIFATNENLQQKVSEFLFRKALFQNQYRRNYHPAFTGTFGRHAFVCTILLSEIPVQIPQNLIAFRRRYKKLCSYNWPGNIRELEHAMERSVILSDHGILQLSCPNLWKIHHRDYRMY